MQDFLYQEIVQDKDRTFLFNNKLIKKIKLHIFLGLLLSTQQMNNWLI